MEGWIVVIIMVMVYIKMFFKVGGANNMKKDLYVVVADNDCVQKMPSGNIFFDDNGPIIFETYTKRATKEEAMDRVRAFRGKYGQCRLAKLEFVNPLVYGFRDHKEDGE